MNTRSTSCLEKYFRHVAKQFFGFSTVKRTRADSLPPRFEKIVHIIIS